MYTSTESPPMSKINKPLLKGHRGPKSKNGCKNCKARRIKCDEEKPNCHQCRRKGVFCEYLPPKPITQSSARSNASSKSSSVPHAQASPHTIAHYNTAGMYSQFNDASRAEASSANHQREGRGASLGNGASISPLDVSVLLNHNNSDGPYSSRSTITLSSPSNEEQVLTEVFFATTTHLFSIYTGACNPFMRLRQYLPQSRALSLAVQAMAALTISGYQSDDKRKHMDRGLELQRMAYQEISQSMEHPRHVHSDAFFAAIVHIGMTEPWHTLRSGESGAMHLKTSKFLISQRIEQRSPLPPKYLCNLLLYWDLLVSLHSDSDVEGYDNQMLFSGVNSEQQPIDYIDPTLGLAVDLVPVIVEMENLLRYVRKRDTDQPIDSRHLESALVIERKLKAWRPIVDSNVMIDCLQVFESTPLQDILFTGEAYRQASLLLLYRTIPDVLRYHDPRHEEMQQNIELQRLASSVIRLLSAILISSPTCTTHEWILFITAPDVVTGPEREFIRDRMSGLLDKIGVVGIREVIDYIEEVWSMIDHGRATSFAWMNGMHERNWYPLLG